MNYEFYFLKRAASREPEILRVMAPSFENAATIVAKRYGWNRAATRHVKEFIESLAIYPVEVENLFERTHSLAN